MAPPDRVLWHGRCSELRDFHILEQDAPFVCGGSRDVARVRGSAGLVCATLLSVAACSGGDGSDVDSAARAEPSATTIAVSAKVRDAYRNATTAVERSFAALQSTGREVLGQDTAALVTFFEAFERDVRDAIEQYEAITPPGHLRSLHERVIGILREEAATLREVVSAARRDDDSRVGTALARLTELLDDFGTTSNELMNRLG
jgi:hypothetical protein